MPRPDLPTHLAWRDTTRDLPGRLLPSEASAVRRACASRRAEFTTGRILARAALRDVGASVSAIGTRHRAPVWPVGFCGSITHCAGYRAAVAASTTRIRAVGIDAEPQLPLPAELCGEVLSASEIELLADTAAHVSFACRVAFSAKESLYKLWSAVTGRWLGFHHAHIVRFHWDGAGGTIRLRLQTPVRDFPGEIEVSGAASDGIVVTAAYIPS
ncbi:4'-phosphopantetheinyl transferase family protein [Phytoactinopolyspora mesophila]|uniref:4'-phosphopantetheinyl transferase superfamily protein n=1 Tax=Phytoactinopolyspora mesophila TaxID=2650750 RepID=A0A7K3LYD4_9ACTN|nr:4'-phosphopantetheinyl transferase superfamily protein [Phytoactinopolyspora mesophila]NDL55827.1 4'-phosphopantetheinyl transferase superfamily protein [Phytoactinopolyspora mesophila]